MRAIGIKVSSVRVLNPIVHPPNFRRYEDSAVDFLRFVSFNLQTEGVDD